MLDEEISELLSALDSHDRPPSLAVTDTIDAIGDISYVVIGAALELGLPLTGWLENWLGSVMKTPMSGAEEVPLDLAADRYWLDRGKPRRISASGTLRKYWRKSDFELVVDVDKLVAELRKQHARFKSGLAHSDPETLLDSVGSMVVSCVLLAYRLGFHLETAFEEIHRSNMTKTTSDEIHRRRDGKIMKGDVFSAPELRTSDD